MKCKFALLAVVCATFVAAARADALAPMPRNAAIDADSCVNIGRNVSIVATGAQSDMLTQAIARYTALMFSLKIASAAPAACNTTVGSVSQIAINVTDPSLELGLNTSEAYGLVIAEGSAQVVLTADTAYAALRGLETLSQLLDYWPSTGAYTLPIATIADSPAFAHRGLLVDTARHFLPLPLLLQILDAMAYSKFNVFHWHIVDDQSFPFVSKTFPQLSAQGAWGAPDAAAVASHTYSPADVQAIISYARLRGIRVVVEFDTPGHSLSWGKGAPPGLLTQCYNTTTNQPIPGSFGPIDPTQEGTYSFIAALWQEVAQTWPDTYVHVGGDEVSFTCWASNPAINSWMASNGIAPGNYSALESYYVQRNLDIVQAAGKVPVGWQEIFDNGLRLTAETIVNVWKYHNVGASETTSSNSGSSNSGRGSGAQAAPTWQAELFNVTAGGFKALVSSPWYLNYIEYGSADLSQFLTVDITAFNGSAAQRALVIGGEVSMWDEFVDGANFISRTFPRATAAAEALWANPGAAADVTDAQARIAAARCRMVNRGIPAEVAVGPSWCPAELVPAYNPPWAASARASAAEL